MVVIIQRALSSPFVEKEQKHRGVNASCAWLFWESVVEVGVRCHAFVCPFLQL